MMSYINSVNFLNIFFDWFLVANNSHQKYNNCWFTSTQTKGLFNWKIKQKGKVFFNWGFATIRVSSFHLWSGWQHTIAISVCKLQVWMSRIQNVLEHIIVDYLKWFIGYCKIDMCHRARHLVLMGYCFGLNEKTLSFTLNSNSHNYKDDIQLNELYWDKYTCIYICYL